MKKKNDIIVDILKLAIYAQCSLRHENKLI